MSHYRFDHQKMKEIMASMGISQAEVARRIHGATGSGSPQTVSSWAKGKSVPSSINDLADVLGVEPIQLMSDTPDPIDALVEESEQLTAALRLALVGLEGAMAQAAAHAMAENAAMILIMGNSSLAIFWSAGAERLLGYSQKEIIAKPALGMLRPEMDFGAVQEAVNEVGYWTGPVMLMTKAGDMVEMQLAVTKVMVGGAQSGMSYVGVPR